MIKRLPVVLGILGSMLVYAKDDIGQLYFAEELKKEDYFQANVGYSQMIDNFLVTQRSAQVSLSRVFGPYHRLGIAGQFYSNKLSQTGKKLREELAQSGVKQSVNLPEYSAFLVYGFSPLHGRMNWFSDRSVPLRFLISPALGTTKFKENFNQDKRQVLSAYLQVSMELDLGDKFKIAPSFKRGKHDPFSKDGNSYSEIGIQLGTSL